MTKAMSVEEKERELAARWERICARQGDDFLDALGHTDRVFSVIWMLEAEINNGGFSQWLFNSYGDHAEFTVTALREIGAEQAAAICERFFAMLPGGKPLGTQDERQDQLDAAAASLGENAFDDACTVLEEELHALEDDLRDRLWAFTKSQN